MTREEVFEYILNQYGADPEYPWIKTPRSAIVRHFGNRKWFAAIVDITEDKLGIKGKNLIDALLLKCDPALKGLFIDHDSIFPAYHMNKEHWITVNLGRPIENEKVCKLIDLSFELTKGKK